MKHNIITTENYLLIVDDSEIKENDYVYVEGHVNPQICKGFENNGDVLCYNNLPYIKEKTKKVISQLPLNNSPILEGVDLLPPLVHPNCCIAKDGGLTNMNKGCAERNRCLPPLEDEVEKLADKLISCSDFIDVLLVKEVWKSGYNKAKEKYKYTEEDLRKAIDMAQETMLVDLRSDEREHKYTKDEIIQSLQQPKMPVAFKCEIFVEFPIDWDGKGIEPKTTTNSQGHTQWVGRYIYE